MSVFRLKQFASDSAHAAADAIRWNYDRAELIADGIVHGVGVFSAIIAVTVLIVLAAVFASAYEIVTVSVYAAGLLAMLGFSAAYNLWPVSRRKWILRRFDHSAIFLLIAGTYTPFLAQLKLSIASAGLSIGVWVSAAVGMALKLLLPGRFDRFAVVLCLLLGWSGLFAYDSFASALPRASLWLLAIGGVLYSLGTIFHVWQRLRFHNAIWHVFVLTGASCHYSAVVACLAAG
jgi:hemolysin III